MTLETAATALTFLQAVSAAGAALAVFRLFRTGLHREYRRLFELLLFSALATSASILLQQQSTAYLILFVGTLPVFWTLYIRTVVELYRHIFQRHQGFYSVGRWSIYAGLTISVCISGGFLKSQISPEMPQVSKVLGILEAVNRGINLSLALCLILVIAVLAFYAVPLNRNLKSHAVLFFFFFVSSTFGAIMRTVFGMKYALAVDVALLAVSCVCLFGWVSLLRPEHELTAKVMPWFRPEHEEIILGKLDALNAALLRASAD